MKGIITNIGTDGDNGTIYVVVSFYSGTTFVETQHLTIPTADVQSDGLMTAARFVVLDYANNTQAYGTLGHYQVAVQTGATAAGMAANGELFQFRWSDATRFALIQKITITGMRATTAFAVGAIDIKATIARSWTVNGTGGTALTLTGEQAQLRTSMGASLAGDVRIATTAALGAGTKTLDTQDIGQIVTHSSGGTGSATPIIGSIYLPTTDIFECDVTDGEHPIVLAQNEGVVIRATVPATGVWNLGVTVKWAEVASF